MSAMRRAEPTFRQELMDARANLQRQIDVLRGWPHLEGDGDKPSGGLTYSDNSALIAQLTEMLREIEEALAALGPWDS
jgi:hypothetical protein